MSSKRLPRCSRTQIVLLSCCYDRCLAGMLELPEDKRPSLGTTHCMELCDIASESTIRSAGPLASILLPVHWTQTTPGMDCPICLQHITLQNEAYLNPCFHRFCFSCIQQWTESQQKHPAAGQACDDREFACPMCKRPYTHILYDCIGKSYRCDRLTRMRTVR